MQNFDDAQKRELRQEINRKFLSTTPNMHTNCHFENRILNSLQAYRRAHH